MAEGIAAGVAANVLTQLSSSALQEISSALGVKKEVQRLQDTLTAIKGVLPHAENLQLSNNNVKHWLRRIKDAAYDAEDVIDDFNTQALRRKLVMHGSIIKRVHYFASSSNPIILRFKIAHRIKEVRENLKYIQDDQSFGFDSNFQVNRGLISEGRETHGYIPEGKVVGRDAEREKIVNLLLLDSSGRNNLSVIPIQGMGGIGKTTLAQLVYNDKRVVDSFGKDRMMWVCVSDEFDLPKITEKIIRSITNEECPKLDMAQLQIRLSQHLGGKRYLLVLDDIWNEEVDKWEKLKDLLIGGASGSTIIVTTRSERVGSIMGTTSVNRLSKLSEDDCWNLFKSRAFVEGQENTDLELVKIGKDIAKKCVGVPLAAKTLGGLCYDQDKQKWEHVRDSDVWNLPEEQNGILRALRISYYYLPFYLQQCFAYCSIFPKDYEIQKDVLIKLWIAQGFIHSSGRNQSLEDIGSEYVKVLMWRSFFQEPVVDDYGNLKEFKMHDLVHDLAQSVAGVECFTVCEDKQERCPEGARHLFFNIGGPCFFFKTSGVIPKSSGIRTLMFAFNIDFSLDSIISNLMFLRVLVFKNDDIDYLPNSIGKLKHLRYLEFICPKIKNFPESITNLQNLQVLKFEYGLLKYLPKKIQNMISLKHIDLGGRIDENFSHMPRGLEELKSLETLSHFVVGKDKVGCALNGLNELSNLGGRLEIWNLKNVENAEESKKTNLKNKKKLEELKLVWNREDDVEGEEVIDFEVLENLEPNSNLKKLGIRSYFATKFPRWLMDSSTSLLNVVDIEMRDCRLCKQLFPLNHLPSLKILKLAFMDNLKYIEEDRPDVQSGKECFSSLTKLEIMYCPNLESWFPAFEEEQQQLISFPCLVELKINDCPKLKGLPLLPSSGIKNLQELRLMWNEAFEEVDIRGEEERFDFKLLENLEPPSNLKIMQISGYDGIIFPRWTSSALRNVVEIKMENCNKCKQLFPLSHLSSLKSLVLNEMDSLEYIEEDRPVVQSGKECFSSLTDLHISDCPNLESWLPAVEEQPQQSLVISFPSLVELIIIDCPKLKSGPQLHYSGVKKLILTETTGEVVESLVGVSNPTNSSSLFTSLRNLTIDNCSGMASWPNWLVGSHLPSLRTLSIGCTQSLPFLPQQIQHLPALQGLGISYYSEEALPEWMANITLGRLSLSYCPNLKILPEWVLRDNTTVEMLWIAGCPHLFDRYNKEAGEDRRKMAHIQYTSIQ